LKYGVILMKEDYSFYLWILIGIVIICIGAGLIEAYYCDHCVATGFSPSPLDNIICVGFVLPPVIGLSMIVSSLCLIYRTKKLSIMR